MNAADHRVILFDVDATLISTSGLGIRAMADAGRELFGEGFSIDGVEFAGRLDPLIIADMLVVNGKGTTVQAMQAFRDGYHRHLRRRLAEPSAGAKYLPGVPAMLRALRDTGWAVTGLLTGNFKETGSLKLGACGIDAAGFDIFVWGDESPSTPPRREDLPPVAMARYRERFGSPIDPASVIVVGDTPHDIRCARESGCRVLAVATGSFNQPQLAAHGACRVVADLSDTDELVRWLAGMGGGR